MTNEEFIAYLNTASCRESIIEHAKKLVAVAEAAKELAIHLEDTTWVMCDPIGEKFGIALEKLEEK